MQKDPHPNPPPAYREREQEASHPLTPSPLHPADHSARRPEAGALGLPFLDVAINPTILDGKGERMSKTKGNGVDPVDIVFSHGADALRFTLTNMATETQDARMPVQVVCPNCAERVPNPDSKEPEMICPKCRKKLTRPINNATGSPDAPLARMTSDRFDLGRNFCNKLWNACRFALSNLENVGSASADAVSPPPRNASAKADPTTLNAIRAADTSDLIPSSLGKSSDEDLMLRTQQGDKLAFSLLYERYSASVLSYLYRMLGKVEEVESIAQEVFLRAFRFSSTYQHPNKFSTWLFTITRNVAIHRAGKGGIGAAPAANDLEIQEEIVGVLKSLDSLPSDERVVVALNLLDPPAHNASAKADPTFTLVDRWIIARFNRTLTACDEAIKSYRFDVYAKSCYDFFWGDFCDWYVEAIKPALKDPARSAQTADVLAAVLDGALRLMHPMIPFITETVWWRLNDVRPTRGIRGRIDCPPSKRLVLAKWPTATPVADSAEEDFAKLQALISAIRTIRNDYQVNPKQSVDVYIKAPAEASTKILADRELVEMLGTCALKDVRADLPAVENAVTAGAAGCDIFVTGLIDPNAEKTRLAKEIEAREKSVQAMKTRLSNEAYIAKAPPKLVQETRDQLANAEAELVKLKESLKKLS
jgi:valyl-tRNA synthetase